MFFIVSLNLVVRLIFGWVYCLFACLFGYWFRVFIGLFGCKFGWILVV